MLKLNQQVVAMAHPDAADFIRAASR